jgi:predicted CopG family antitoxin
MKSLVVSDENWEKLQLQKLKQKKSSIDEVITELLKKGE